MRVCAWEAVAWEAVAWEAVAWEAVPCYLRVELVLHLDLGQLRLHLPSLGVDLPRRPRVRRVPLDGHVVRGVAEVRLDGARLARLDVPRLVRLVAVRHLYIGKGLSA